MRVICIAFSLLFAVLGIWGLGIATGVNEVEPLRLPLAAVAIGVLSLCSVVITLYVGFATLDLRRWESLHCTACLFLSSIALFAALQVQLLPLWLSSALTLWNGLAAGTAAAASVARDVRERRRAKDGEVT